MIFHLSTPIIQLAGWRKTQLVIPMPQPVMPRPWGCSWLASLFMSGGVPFTVGCLVVLLGPLSLSEGSHQWQWPFSFSWWGGHDLGGRTDSPEAVPPASMLDLHAYCHLPGPQVPCCVRVGGVGWEVFASPLPLLFAFSLVSSCLGVRGHPWLLAHLSHG